MKSRKRVALLIAIHLSIVALIWLLTLFWQCPFRLLLGVSCLGCGVTRAWEAALSLDFGAAFACHPLFLLAPFVLLLPAHFRPFSRRFGKRTVSLTIAALLVVFVITYIIRLWLHDPVVWPDFEHSLLYALTISLT